LSQNEVDVEFGRHGLTGCLRKDKNS